MEATTRSRAKVTTAATMATVAVAVAPLHDPYSTTPRLAIVAIRDTILEKPPLQSIIIDNFSLVRDKSANRRGVFCYFAHRYGAL
jgi:hypothetical protein